MIDLEAELTRYGERWRDAQPPVRSDLWEPGRQRLPIARGLAFVLILVIVLIAGLLVVITRDGGDTPTITPPADMQVPDGGSVVPTVDVVPLYLPNDAADIYAAGDLGSRISILPASNPPSSEDVANARTCDIGLATRSSREHYAYFEDPGQYRGVPSAPTIQAPPPPTARPSCTPQAADAAAAIRGIEDTIRWHDTIRALEASPEIAAARQIQIGCLAAQGIDDVSSDGFITDGWFQRNPDQVSRANLAFADCIEPVVSARDAVRNAARAAYIADHPDQIRQLQAALDDYLQAIYAPEGRPPTTATPANSGTAALVGPLQAPTSLNWYEEMLWHCDHGDYGVLAGPDGMVRVGDRGTGGLALMTPKDYCYQAAHLSPSPTGTLVSNLAVALNGVLHPDYFERVDNGGGQVTNGAPVDFDEAQRIIAQQRAALG